MSTCCKENQFDGFVLIECRRLELKLIQFQAVTVNFKSAKGFYSVTMFRYLFLFLCHAGISTEDTVQFQPIVHRASVARIELIICLISRLEMTTLSKAVPFFSFNREFVTTERLLSNDHRVRRLSSLFSITHGT